MREGKISRELVFENWRIVEPAIGHVAYVPGAPPLSPHHPTF
jgi:hypothetical protein